MGFIYLCKVLMVLNMELVLVAVDMGLVVLVEVKRQIESVVEEKGWKGNEQPNQESSKGGERFRNSPNFYLAPSQGGVFYCLPI